MKKERLPLVEKSVVAEMKLKFGRKGEKRHQEDDDTCVSKKTRKTVHYFKKCSKHDEFL